MTKKVRRTLPIIVVLFAFVSTLMVVNLFAAPAINTDLESLGEIVDNHGFAAVDYWPEGNLMYTLGKDPISKDAVFVAYDLTTRQIKYQGKNPDKQRDIMVDNAGNAYFPADDASGITKYDPRTNKTSDVVNSLPSGGVVRASTRESSSGWIYGMTENASGSNEYKIFRFRPANNQFEEIGEALHYTTSVVLDPTEQYLYYVPGSHGTGDNYGTPVIQYDVSTNKHKVMAYLHKFIKDETSHSVQGTYGLALSDDGKKLYIPFNGIAPDHSDLNYGDTGSGFGAGYLVVLDLPSGEIGYMSDPQDVQASIATRDDTATVQESVFERFFPRAESLGADFSFTDVTHTAGLRDELQNSYAHSAAWGDVNNDGWEDLFVGMFTTNSVNVTNKLFINNAGQGFTRSIQPALEFNGRVSGSSFVDLDNDNDLDLVVTSNRVGPDSNKPFNAVENHLFRNDNGIFIDASNNSGLHAADRNARNAAVIDYNNDGLQDLFISADGLRSPSEGVKGRLFRNDGNMRFSDVTNAANIPDIQGLGLAVGDFNGDGWPDMFVTGGDGSNNYSLNYMLINNKDGTFRSIDGGDYGWYNTNGSEDWVSGANIGDLNRDGRLDLVVTHHFGSSDAQGKAIKPRIYINKGNRSNGNPNFDNVTNSSGIAGIPVKSPHVELQDMNNDGWPDITISIKANTGSGAEPFIYQHDGLDQNGNPTFNSPSYSSLDYYPGGPVADYDRDGKLDVFFEDFRFSETNNYSPLFKNNTAGGNWLKISASDGNNTYGYGAKVTIYEEGGLEDVTKIIGHQEIRVGNGYSSGQPTELHFGLGAINKVDVKVQMPFSGGVSSPEFSAQNVNVNQAVTAPNLGGNGSGGGGPSSPTPSQDAHLDLETTMTSLGSGGSLLNKPGGANIPGGYSTASIAPSVEFARLPTQNHKGTPWSQWSEPLLASNGRLYLIHTDHNVPKNGKPPGNSFVYEYNPVNKRLRMVGDSNRAAGNIQNGDWGHGGAHSKIIESTDGYLYTTSYWGSANGISFNNRYKGSVILRYPLGVPTGDPGDPPGVIGDVNNDGRVNIFDLSMLLSRWGDTSNISDVDVNDDGTINIFDLSIMLSNWGS